MIFFSVKILEKTRTDGFSFSPTASPHEAWSTQKPLPHPHSCILTSTLGRGVDIACPLLRTSDLSSASEGSRGLTYSPQGGEETDGGKGGVLCEQLLGTVVRWLIGQDPAPREGSVSVA